MGPGAPIDCRPEISGRKKINITFSIFQWHFRSNFLNNILIYDFCSEVRSNCEEKEDDAPSASSQSVPMKFESGETSSSSHWAVCFLYQTWSCLSTGNVARSAWLSFVSRLCLQRPFCILVALLWGKRQTHKRTGLQSAGLWIRDNLLICRRVCLITVIGPVKQWYQACTNIYSFVDTLVHL